MSDHVLANRHSYTVWLGYASFVTLTLVAILISPAVAANESWIGVVIALACSVPMACIPWAGHGIKDHDRTRGKVAGHEHWFVVLGKLRNQL